MSEPYLADPSIHGNENTRIRGSIIGTWALALIAVCLRFFARRRSKAGFWYDDWLMVPATVSRPKEINSDNCPNSH